MSWDEKFLRISCSNILFSGILLLFWRFPASINLISGKIWKINNRPAPNKGVLGGKLMQINKNVLDYYSGDKSTFHFSCKLYCNSKIQFFSPRIFSFLKKNVRGSDSGGWKKNLFFNLRSYLSRASLWLGLQKSVPQAFVTIEQQ